MTQIVQIPTPQSPQFGSSVKQWINVRDGAVGPTGLKPDRFVEVRDLFDPAFINALAVYKHPITRVNTDYGYTGDTSAPRPPTNLQITSEVFRNILTWDDPNSDNFWYIEVYRAKVPAGDAAPTVGNAVKIASVPKTVESFVDTEVSITSYDHYYWIRAVSYGGIASLWQDGYIEGHTTINATIDSIMTTLKGADPDAWSSIVDYVADDRVLQGGKRYKCILANLNQVPPNVTYWEQSGILITGDIGGVSTVGIDGNLVVDDTILARCINVDDAFIGMTIRSTVFTPGSVGWQINKDGDVEFNSGVFRGTLVVASLSTITANMGTLTSGSIVIGSTNKIWLNDSADGALNIGGAVKASAPFRVTAAGVLTATGATISGAITLTGGSGILNLSDAGSLAVLDEVTAGEINVTNLAAINANMGTITAGNITLNTSGFLRTSGKDNYADTTAGFFLGYDSGYKLNIGSATNHIKWDGTNLILTGKVLDSSNWKNYTVGNFLVIAADTERCFTYTMSWTKIKEIVLEKGGALRIKFSVKDASPSGFENARIYRNGGAVGTERTLTDTYVEWSEDISGWSSNDLVQLYLETPLYADESCVKNFRIYASDSTAPAVILD